MRHTFTIIIKKESGETYKCTRLANDEEQAISMVKLPEGEIIVEVIKNITNIDWEG